MRGFHSYESVRQGILVLFFSDVMQLAYKFSTYCILFTTLF